MRPNPYADTPFEEQPRPDTALLASKILEKPSEAGSASHSTPVVTVVTAVFNAIKEGRKEELLQCLDSVQSQTGTVIEHLIIDGASKDGTAELIRNYRNPRVPIRLLSEPDEGIYDAMNRGLYLASGKYVIFLNSDDYYSDPSGLAESVRRLEESCADFSYAPICVLDETTGQPVDHLLNRPNINIVFLEMPFSHQSMMIRREALLEIGGFDLRYRSGADYDSVLRLIFTGHRACFVPVTFVAFRLGGFSFINVGQSQQEVGTIFSRLYKKYLDFDLTPEEGTRIYLTKLGPKELRQRQFRFAKSAFGSEIDAPRMQDGYLASEKLLIFQYRLQAIKKDPHFVSAMRVIARMIFSTPILFGRFMLRYVSLRRKLDRKEAGKEAYLQLLACEQKKRRKKMLAASRPDDSSTILTRPRLTVTCQDFWCVSGIYAGESWGAWSGKKFSVFFNLPSEYLHQPLTAEVKIGGYVFPGSPKRTVRVTVNNREITRLAVDNFLPQPHTFRIPGELVTSAALDIDFAADQAFSPKALGVGEDTRELGMTFRKLSIRKADSSIAASPAPADRQEIKVGFLNHFNKWWVGGITYFKNLFQAMATTESPRLIPYIFPSPDELADCLKPYSSEIPAPPPSGSLDRLPVAADYGMDVLSHLNGNQVSEGCDGIAWIADFQHVHLPEMFDEQEIAFRNHSFHTLIEQNRIVCLSSYDAMEDFKNYAPEAAHKARCLHFVSVPEPGVYQLPEKDAAEIRKNRQLPERYFYVPNQFWKHKNHIVVLRAIALLKKSGCPIHVVFSGNTYDSRFPHYFEELEAFCHQEGIEENVHFLGLIPLKEVYFLMRDCIAMVNPSKFEGWSSSVEEAKSIGKTMILSHLNVHYEQAPPNGSYFPCDDPVWLADLLKRAWNELKPGPDLAMEAKARAALPGRLKAFGKDFQEIVLDALSGGDSGARALQSAPQVTVVTVVRDLRKEEGQKALIRTLGSVASQKNATFEHLLVVGAAAGAPAESLQPSVEKYGCRVIAEPDHGLCEAMNHGLIHARGRYVAFLEPGDEYGKCDFLSASLAALEKNGADFSYTAGERHDPDGTRAVLGMPFPLPAILFRRKSLCHMAGFNDTLGAAGVYDLLLRMILSGKKGVRSGCAKESVSAAVSPLDEGEAARVLARNLRRLDGELTLEEGREILQKKRLPESLQKRVELLLAETFPADGPQPPQNAPAGAR